MNRNMLRSESARMEQGASSLWLTSMYSLSRMLSRPDGPGFGIAGFQPAGVRRRSFLIWCRKCLSGWNNRLSAFALRATADKSACGREEQLELGMEGGANGDGARIAQQ